MSTKFGALAIAAVVLAGCAAPSDDTSLQSAPKTPSVADLSCADAKFAVNEITDEATSAISRGEMPQGRGGAKLGDAMALVLERPDCFTEEDKQAAQAMLDLIDQASK